MDRTERRICWYSSLLIALLINTPKLLALREGGIIAHYWHFNLSELLFQLVFTFAFGLLLFQFNLNTRFWFSIYLGQKKYSKVLLLNSVFFIVFVILTGAVQRRLFDVQQLPKVYWTGCLARMGLCAMLVAILIKIVLLLRIAKTKELENEQMKTAYMAAELELLKEQMNPHFLFNSLSSLSGVIREDPKLAQKYVRELSNVFRYAITHSKVNLVTLGDELLMLKSFAELITMRLEGAFELTLVVPDRYLPYKLPHLSLQPLLENAVKHNAATVTRPLQVIIAVAGEHLIVTNNLWPIAEPENSTGLGLANLNQRFKIMTGHDIEITQTDSLFKVQLPLKP